MQINYSYMIYIIWIISSKHIKNALSQGRDGNGDSDNIKALFEVEHLSLERITI